MQEHKVEAYAPVSKFGHELSVVRGTGSMRNPLRVHREGSTHLRGSAPFAGVERDPKATGPGSIEGSRGDLWIRIACLGTREVPAGQPAIDEPRGGFGEGHVGFGIMGSKRRADQAHGGPGLGRRPRSPRHDRIDPGFERQPIGYVEERPPSDLHVANLVGRLVLDQLGRDALEGIGILHQRDGQVEGAEQIRLIRRSRRADEDAAHAGPGGRTIGALLRCASS